MDEHLRCPKCGQADMVRKASGLYKGGISEIEQEVWMPPPPKSELPPLLTTRKGISQTAQSKHLAPPTKPKYKSPWGCWVIGGILALLGSAVALFQNIGAEIVYGRVPTGPAMTVLVIGCSIYVGLLALIVLWASSQARKRRYTFEQEIHVWERAMQKWNRLYYCARDDGVFISGQSRLIPANRMVNLLYEEENMPQKNSAKAVDHLNRDLRRANNSDLDDAIAESSREDELSADEWLMYVCIPIGSEYGELWPILLTARELLAEEKRFGEGFNAAWNWLGNQVPDDERGMRIGREKLARGCLALAIFAIQHRKYTSAHKAVGFAIWIGTEMPDIVLDIDDLIVGGAKHVRDIAVSQGEHHAARDLEELIRRKLGRSI